MYMYMLTRLSRRRETRMYKYRPSAFFDVDVIIRRAAGAAACALTWQTTRRRFLKQHVGDGLGQERENKGAHFTERRRGDVTRGRVDVSDGVFHEIYYVCGI